MKLSSALTLGIAAAVTMLVVVAMNDHVRFMRKAAGVMTADGAAAIGLPVSAGPWFKRVWFAPVGDGSYEVRPAAAVIGVMPFTSTLTKLDLAAACKRLGNACQAH